MTLVSPIHRRALEAVRQAAFWTLEVDRILLCRNSNPLKSTLIKSDTSPVTGSIPKGHAPCHFTLVLVADWGSQYLIHRWLMQEDPNSRVISEESSTILCKKESHGIASTLTNLLQEFTQEPSLSLEKVHSSRTG
jgi:hypothetical protein